jgi:Leucine-rich repeat (LRR) protein/tRNA A-37 threonylcarbamoyl transferase component Bud32
MINIKAYLFGLIFFIWALHVLVQCKDIDLDASSSQNSLERDILTKLYAATNGNNWHKKEYWLSNETICWWDGITCNTNGSVVHIFLDSNQLSGTLPDSFGCLINLQYFSVNFNNITGTIPDSLGQLVDLQHLDLEANNFYGSIPASFGQLHKLARLHLSSNKLSGTIPESLGQLKNLQQLYITNNNLNGSLPYSLGQLTNLQLLLLNENQLSGTIPESLGNLSNLFRLSLYSNQLSGTIPESLGQLYTLIYMSLSANLLTGTLPDSFGSLASIRWLHIRSNQLSGTIPSSIGNLINLIRLNMYSNQLYGTIPDSIGRLSDIEYLDLHSNQLSGTIPHSIGLLRDLEYLRLDSNQFSGTLPESLTRLSDLKILSISFNDLSGTISNSIGRLVDLQALRLASNQFSGEIPESIGRLTTLQLLDLSSNQLSGTIPLSLGQLGDLQTIAFNSNQLLGSIPDSFWRMVSLKNIFLSNNLLEGTISNSIVSLQALTTLTVANNFFVGSLPNLEALSFLRVVNISNNHIQGCLALPPQFLNSTSTTCDVQNNELCCSHDQYPCFSASCSIDSTLVVSNGMQVVYNYSNEKQRIVVEKNATLVVYPSKTIRVNCLQFDGEIIVDLSGITGNLGDVNLISSICYKINPNSLISTRGGNCSYNIIQQGNNLRGSVICQATEDTLNGNKIIIIVSSIIGSIIIVATITILVLFIRRRRRIKQLKSRVEMLTISSVNLDKSSFPPNEFKFKLLEDLPIKLSKTSFQFGNKKDLLIVDKVSTDKFTVQLKRTLKQYQGVNNRELHESLVSNGTVVQLRPVMCPKYKLAIDPQVFTIQSNLTVEVTINLQLTMTTKTKVSFWIELPEEELYSLIEFDAASEPSPWIDTDEIIIEGNAIGEGAFASVYKARYREQQVAFKSLKMQELGLQFNDEFEQEVRMMMNLRHKSIVQFIGASRVQGKLAILTEFMPQGNLSSLLASQRLELELKLKIIKDIADGLLFLHSNNILHRDIKAENVLVVSTSTDAIINVKVADFGTARSVNDQFTTGYTKGIGTPSYMAVEILRNEHYGRSADIYSFGVLMWTVFTQEEPYKDIKYSWDLADFVLQGKRLPIPADCPNQFRELISTCWAQNPQDRPTIQQIVHLLSTISNFVTLDG